MTGLYPGIKYRNTIGNKRKDDFQARLEGSLTMCPRGLSR
jgi:hypothetical protein